MKLKKKQDYGQYVTRRKFILFRGLEFLILASGVYQTLFGETVIGLMTLFCLALIVVPGFFTRGRVTQIPIEIEIFLFVMVLLQFVIGEANDFYTNVPYYDKFVHYMLPLFLGLMGFVVVYTMYVAGNLKASSTVMALLVIFVALGIGALWEIMEYLSDEILYPRIPGWHHFQGSLTEDALHDTMNDLIVDLLGAITGALLAVWLIGRAERKRSGRLDEMFDQILGQMKT